MIFSKEMLTHIPEHKVFSLFLVWKNHAENRIAFVEFAGKPFKNCDRFEEQIPDVFGFSFSGETFPIQLELDLKQVLLLKEQYPSTSSFIHYNTKKKCFELKVQVNDLKPIERFMRGSQDPMN